MYRLAHPNDHDIHQVCISSLVAIHEIDGLQESSTIVMTHLPSKGKRGYK